MKKLKVILKEPGRPPRSVYISDTLKNLQTNVGGYIEAVTLDGRIVVICDEEGRLKGKPHCCTLCGVDFVGTVILCGAGGDGFADLPVPLEELRKRYPSLWEG